MGSMGSIGTVDAKFEASTGNFTASLTGIHESLGKTAAKAKEAGAQVKAALGDMTVAAQKARFATLMASDAEVSVLGKVTAARERALRSWQREKLAQDRAADTAAVVARANELAAMKADMLASADERLGLSTNKVVAGFQLMGREVRESLNGIGEKIAATAERAELSADGMAAAFGGIGKLVGVGIAGDFAAHMLDNIAELNVRLGDLHEKTGIAVQDLAGLRLAALSKGLNFETVGRGITRLGRAIGEAKEGMLEAREAFSSVLGKDAAKYETDSVEQMFYRLSRAIHENKSLAVQDAVAMELFGKGGQELIPVLREWGGELEGVVKQQAALTGVTDKSVAASQKWLQMTTDISAEFHADMIPVLMDIVKLTPYVQTGFHLLQVGVEESLGSLINYGMTLIDLLGGVGKVMDDLAQRKFGSITKDWGDMLAKNDRRWKQEDKFIHDDAVAAGVAFNNIGGTGLQHPFDVPDVNRPGNMDGAMLKAAKQDLANRERKHSLTQKQLIAFWQSYLKKAKPGSTDYEQINLVLGSVMQRAGRGAASRAAKEQMEGFEQGLADMKGAHEVSVAEEYDYWAKKLEAVHSGSSNYLKITREMGSLYQKILKDQDALNKQYAKGSLMIQPAQLIGFYGQRAQPPAPLPAIRNSAMTSENQRHIHTESVEQLRYLQNLKRTAEARATLADRASESAVKLAQARGEMSRLDAAEVLAAIHADAYNRRLQALKDSLEAIRNSGLEPNERNEQLLGTQNQIDELRAAHSAQAIQDNTAIDSAKLSGSIRNVFQLYVADAEDAATQISQILTDAFQSVNDSLAQSLMAHAYNGREYRRNIENGLGETARGLGSEILGIGIKHAEGGLLGKLGFGPKGKLGESESTAMWVRMAGTQAGGSASSILSALKAGGSSGASTTGSVVSTMIGLLPLAGFADGGSIPSGLPAIVGERGPELFVPSTAGHIVPNHQLGFGGTHLHMPVTVDARGSHDPAAVEAAAHRAVMAAAPQIAAAAFHLVREDKLRKPNTVR